MFRVSVKEESDSISLYVEGRLAGPWVLELDRCWQLERARAGAKFLAVRLGAVTFIDDDGKALLARMFQGGAKLEGHGCLVRAILAGITGHRESEDKTTERGLEEDVTRERSAGKRK